MSVRLLAALPLGTSALARRNFPPRLQATRSSDPRVESPSGLMLVF